LIKLRRGDGLRKEDILKVLIESGTSVTTEELAKKMDMDLVRLRIDLYHLEAEGKVEKRLRGNQTAWTVKLGSIPEHSFERRRRYP